MTAPIIKHTQRNPFRRGALVAALASAALALGACDGVGGSSEADHLERAAKHMDEGRYDSAVIEYRNALQQNADAETRALLGLAHKRQGRLDDGINHLQRGLEAGADTKRYTPHLARALFRVDRWGDIADLSLPEGLDDSERAQLLAYQALGHFQRGDSEAGTEALDSARALDPDLAEVHLADAFQALSAGETDAAWQAVEAALSADDSLAAAWGTKGDLSQWRGDTDGALAAYGKAVELRPQVISNRFKRALVLVEQGELDKAREDADFLREGAPGHPAGHYLTGLIHYERGDRSASRPHFQEALSAHRNYRPAMQHLASVQLSAGNLSQAEHLLERYHATGNGTAMSYRLKARLRVEQGRPEAAREVLAEALERQPELITGLGEQLAVLHMEAGDAEQSIRTLRQALVAQPDSVELQEMLGVALLQSGDADQGLAMLQQVADTTPEIVRADIVVAVGHLNAGRYEEALAAGERIREKQPDSPNGYNFMAAALLGMNEIDEARLVYQEGMAKLPGDPSLGMNLAMMELVQENREAGIAALEAIQEHNPGHAPSAMRLAELAHQAGDTGASTRWLEKTIEHHPQEAQPYLLLARLQLDGGTPGEAATTLERGLEHHPEHPLMLFALGDIREQQGDHESAASLFHDLTAVDEDNAEAYYRQARNLTALGDNDGARTALERSVELEPDDLSARIALVRLLAADGEIEAARAAFEPLETGDHQDRPVVKAQLGWFHNEAGRYEEAAAAYGEALAGETRRSWTLARYRAQLQADQPDAAKQTLQDWLERHPGDGVARHLLAARLMEGNQTDEAETLYREQIEQYPEDYLALNNLAWLLRESRPEEALGLAEQATELAPEAPEILDTLGVVLLYNSRPDEAREVLEKAHEMAPGQPGIQFNLARSLEAAGDTERARAVLDRLLADESDFPDRQRAEELLQTLDG